MLVMQLNSTASCKSLLCFLSLRQSIWLQLRQKWRLYGWGTFFLNLNMVHTQAASTLKMNNQSAISVFKNSEHYDWMKHLDLCFYWLRDEVKMLWFAQSLFLLRKWLQTVSPSQCQFSRFTLAENRWVSKMAWLILSLLLSSLVFYLTLNMFYHREILNMWWSHVTVYIYLGFSHLQWSP